jgi:hypothetical protein
MHQAKGGTVEGMAFLLAHKPPALPNLKDHDGYTALHWAVNCGDSPAKVRLLLDYGADKTIRDIRGKTALDCGREKLKSRWGADPNSNHTGCVDVLESYTPTPPPPLLPSAIEIKDVKIAVRLIYLESGEPDVVKVTNVEMSESLESIASKDMDATSHQILHVIVDGEIADGKSPLEKLFMGNGGDELGEFDEEEEEEMKVAHILLGKIAKSRHCGQDIEIYISNSVGRTKGYHIDRCASILELKEMILIREGIPIKAMMLIYAGRKLEDVRYLDDYNIQKENKIHLIVRSNLGNI